MRDHYGQAGMKADAFDVINAGQLINKPSEVGIRKCKRVSTTEDNFAQAGVVSNIVETFLPMLPTWLIVSVRKMSSETIATMNCAT